MIKLFENWRARFCVIFLLLAAACGSALAASKAQQGFQLYQNRQYKEAAQLFDEHLVTNPRDGTVYYYDAVCYQQLGNMGRATALYKQVVKLLPNSQLAKYASQILQKVDPNFRAAQVNSAQPTSNSQATTSTPSADPEESTPERNSKLIGPDEGAVYYRSQGREMMVTVEFNGRPVEMELDTGAPGITIGKEQLSNAGVKPPEGPPDGAVGGSSNNVEIAYNTMRTSLRIGPFTLNNANVKVLEINSAVPLLGQGFLRHFDYTVDQSAHCIRLRRKDAAAKSQQAASGVSVPFTFREAGNRIIVEVDINGKKGNCMLDTGNSASVLCFHSPEQAGKYGAPVPSDADTVVHKGISGSGQAYKYTCNRIKLGPIEKVYAQVSADIGHDDDEEPLLGHEFFEGWQYTIDMKNKRIHLLRR